MIIKFLLPVLALWVGGSLYGMEQDTKNTALRGAICSWRTEAVKALIAAGADINTPVAKYGDTPLIQAIKEQCLEIVEVLIASGVDVNAPGKEKNVPFNVPLIVAVAQNNCALKMVKALIGAGAHVNTRDTYGATALMEATWRGHTEMVKALIEAGADVNMQDSLRFFALRVAIRQENIHLVNVLIKAGAHVNTRDSSDDTLLMEAVRRGYTDIVKTLVVAGADVNAQGRYSDTPLMGAMRKRCFEMVEIVIAGGANVNAQTKNGDLCLIDAIRDKDIEIVKALIVAGADFTVQNKQGKNALTVAAELGQEKVDAALTKVLIAAGGLLATDVKNYSEYSVFGKELFEIAKLEFPDTKDKERDPVGYVSQMEILKTGMSKLRAFASEHAFVDLVDELGNTPLHYAVLAGNRPMVVLLVYLMAQAKYAASVTHKNNGGYSPIDIAVVKSPKYILPLFMKMLCVKPKVTVNQ